VRQRRPHRIAPGLYRRRRPLIDASPTLIALVATAVIVGVALLVAHLIVS
jgi:hypothetical protein